MASSSAEAAGASSSGSPMQASMTASIVGYSIGQSCPRYAPSSVERSGRSIAGPLLIGVSDATQPVALAVRCRSSGEGLGIRAKLSRQHREGRVVHGKPEEELVLDPEAVQELLERVGAQDQRIRGLV